MMAYSFRGSRVLKQGLKLLCLFLAVTGVMLLAAHLALRHPAEAAAVRAWMNAHRYGWFAWRLMLYVAIGWGGWKIWHAPGFRPEYRQPLLRMLTVSAVIVLICERVLLGGGA
jgi:hypothetical protein